MNSAIVHCAFRRGDRMDPLSRRRFLTAAGSIALVPPVLRAVTPNARVTLTAATPAPAPEWALLQRQLLHAHTEACEIFHSKYFDARHHLLCFPRWGTNDGPDDAIEHVNDWPLLHALGGSDRILELYRAVYEGHIEQYSALRTTQVPSGREGMYVREFPAEVDWEDIRQGLATIDLIGLSIPAE